MNRHTLVSSKTVNSRHVMRLLSTSVLAVAFSLLIPQICHAQWVLDIDEDPGGQVTAGSTGTAATAVSMAAGGGTPYSYIWTAMGQGVVQNSNTYSTAYASVITPSVTVTPYWGPMASNPNAVPEHGFTWISTRMLTAGVGASGSTSQGKASGVSFDNILSAEAPKAAGSSASFVNFFGANDHYDGSTLLWSTQGADLRIYSRVTTNDAGDSEDFAAKSEITTSVIKFTDDLFDGTVPAGSMPTQLILAVWDQGMSSNASGNSLAVGVAFLHYSVQIDN